MNVFVLNKNGNPLMPCKPAKARKRLRDGLALVVNREPFTIQLLWDCEENVQPITVGIDKGSHTTGFSCVTNGRVVMSGQIKHRTDIKSKMEARSNNRRNRRSRKWYREKRFDNRASVGRSGRIPPSVKANALEVIRAVKSLPLPVGQIMVEDVQIDIARLNDPTLHGTDYQQSNRLDENLRIATLSRDGYQCTQCGKRNTKLEAHHILPRSEQGKDTINNLLTLCHSCHTKHHKGKLLIDAGGVSAKLDVIGQRTMQGKTYMYEQLSSVAKVEKVFGYQTSAFRKSIGISKSHDADALCIATLRDGEVVSYQRDNFYEIKFRPRQTRRQYYDLPKKGKGRVRYQVNAELDGFRKGDLVRVKGRWVKQIHSIYTSGQLAFARVKGEPSAVVPKHCQLLQRGATVIWKRGT